MLNNRDRRRGWAFVLINLFFSLVNLAVGNNLIALIEAVIGSGVPLLSLLLLRSYLIQPTPT